MRYSQDNDVKDNRVAAYIRVSDDSQVEGHSLEAQQHEISRWCQNKGYEVVRVYTEAGVSAHKDEIESRPELMKLLGDAPRNQFDIVVVHTLDRWARKLKNQIHALDILAKEKKGFASVCDPFDASTPHGRLMLNQMGSYNEFFSDLLGIHVSKSFKLMAEQGLTVGPVPFAYRNQTKILPSSKVEVLPPIKIAEEAEANIESFKLRDEGQSYGQIAAWLNSKGFRTQGHPFTAHAVKDMLNNHYYCGWVKYKGKEYKGQHEAIISEELFQRVQNRKQRREIVRTVHGPKGLLQGMVACSHCGNPLQSDRQHQLIPLYRERHVHDCPTNNRSIMAEVIDKQAATIIHSLDLSPEWSQKMAKLASTNHEGPSPESLKEKRRRLSRAYAEEAYTEDEYNRRLAEIDRQLQASCVITPPDIEEAEELFSNIPMLWNEATPEERSRLINPLIEMVYVDIETKKVTAFKPAPAFRALFNAGIEVSPDAPMELVPYKDVKEDIVGVGGDGGGPVSTLPAII